MSSNQESFSKPIVMPQRRSVDKLELVRAIAPINTTPKPTLTTVNTTTTTLTTASTADPATSPVVRDYHQNQINYQWFIQIVPKECSNSKHSICVAYNRRYERNFKPIRLIIRYPNITNQIASVYTHLLYEWMRCKLVSYVTFASRMPEPSPTPILSTVYAPLHRSTADQHNTQLHSSVAALKMLRNLIEQSRFLRVK